MLTKFNLFSLLCLLYSSISAQHLIEPRLTTNEGLSQGFVEDICQDELGFMWFTTSDGLNRYDGRSIKILRHIQNDSTSFPKTGVNQIIQSRQGNLWLRVKKGGLCYYHARQSIFEQINISASQVFDIKLGSNDDVFALCKGQFIYHVKRNNGNFKIDSIPLPQTTQYVYDLNLEASGKMTLLLHDRLYYGHIKNLGKWEQEPAVSIDLLKDSSPKNHSFTKLYKAPNGDYWIAGHVGMLIFDGKHSRKLDFPMCPNYGVARYGLRSVTIDKLGNAWLLFNRSVIKIESSHVDHPKSEDLVYQKSLGLISKIYQDRSGLLWFSLNGLGIATISPLQQAFNHSHHGQVLYNLLKDKNGKIWTGHELNTNSNNQTFGIRTPMVEDDSGRIWIRTGVNPNDENNRYNAFKRIDSVGNVIEEVRTESSIPDLSNYVLFKSRDGLLWMASIYEIISMDLNGRVLKTYPFVSQKSNDNELHVTCILETKQGKFLIGTAWGIFKFDPGTGAFEQLGTELNRVGILCMERTSEPEETVWIGTKGAGLFRLDVASGKISPCIQHGIDQASNVIYGIFDDGSGHLWFSSNSGITRYHKKSGKCLRFGKQDGTQSSEFNTFSYLKDETGKFYFGGMNGLNAFYPEEIKLNDIPPKIYLSNVKINDRATHEGIDVFRSKELHLSHNQNTLSFEYIALDFHDPKANKYQIKLEGVNNSWVNMGNNTSATYSNLSPGTYILRVRASNNHGIWSEEARLKIVVSPPWWATWWAYTLYAIIAILLIGSFLFLRTRRIKLTERLRREEEEAKKLKELDTLKTNFVSNVIHEFRTPLTLMFGPIEKVMKEVSPEHKEDLMIAERSGKKIMGLVNQLLDLAKLESSSMQIELHKGDIISYCKKTIETFHLESKRKKISLTHSFEVSEYECDFDPDKLEKVLRNLLSNALKFTEENGHVNIEIRLNSSEFVFQISDTGVGIPSTAANQIFDRFYQVDGSSTRRQEGTGIGLALCKELVELMGGNISATPNKNQGTIFSFTLPLIQNATTPLYVPAHNNVETDNLNTNELHLPQKTTSHGDLEILVIEDNDDLRQYMQHMLQSTYKVSVATNGEEGIKLAIENIPDIVITDVMMPVKDGFDVCKELKSNQITCHIPVIMLTAKTSLQSKLEGLEVGADVYLTKPFNQDELFLRIEKMVELRHTLRDFFLKAHSEIPENNEKSGLSPLDLEFMAHLNQILEANLSDNKLNFELLVKELGMSKSQIYRKLKALTNRSINHYIRHYRLHRSIDFLKSERYSLKEIAYMTGFSSQSYFTRSFRTEFGCTPSEYIS